MTRYEFAMETLSLLDHCVFRPTPLGLGPDTLRESAWLLGRLLREYWAEIVDLQAKLTELDPPLTTRLANVPASHWFYRTAQALLAVGSPGAAPPAPQPAVVVARPFPDVRADHWAVEAVERLRRAGVVIGYPDGTFTGEPVAPAAHGNPAETVPFEHWAYDAIQELVDEGIIIAYPGGGGSDRRMTQDEFRKAIERLLDWLKAHPELAEPSGPPR
jgi:hypothetical protein